MFKKICFMVCAISMFCSAESFAKRHPYQENLERRSIAKRSTKTFKALRKEQVAEKRLARQTAKAKKTEQKYVRKNSKKIRAQKRQAQKDQKRQVAVSRKTTSPKTESFTGRTILKNARKDSLNVSGPFEFDRLEVKNDTHISGFTSRSRNGKFNNLKVSGSFEATDVTCKNFNVSGAVVVDNLEVENEASISGAVNASNMRCRTLNVSGAVIAEKLKVAQDASISGRLGAAQSHFQNLKVASDTIVLKDTQVDGNITLRNIHGWPNKQQILRLEGNTRIKGTITFESGKGLIEKTPAVMVIGTVKGARVHTR